MQERQDCLNSIKEAHEEDEHAFPAKYCIDLFEELVAAWCEEVRESRRKLCALLGSENPRLEDLKLVALAPGPDGTPNFSFPNVFDLSDSEGPTSRSSCRRVQPTAKSSAEDEPGAPAI